MDDWYQFAVETDKAFNTDWKTILLLKEFQTSRAAERFFRDR
jgi:hypothetical protein